MWSGLGSVGMAIEIVALVIGVPTFLMGLTLLLARFEDLAVQPGERAAKVTELLLSAHPPEDVERATAQMLAACAPATPRQVPDRDAA